MSSSRNVDNNHIDEIEHLSSSSVSSLKDDDVVQDVCDVTESPRVDPRGVAGHDTGGARGGCGEECGQRPVPILP